MARRSEDLLSPLHLWGYLFALVLHAAVLALLIAQAQRLRGVPPKPRPIPIAIQLAPAATQTARATAPPKPPPVEPPRKAQPTPPKPVEKPKPQAPAKPVQAAPKPVVPPAPAPTPPKPELVKAPTAEEIAIAGERGLMSHIRSRWLRPPRINPRLQCVVRVQIEADGHIVSVNLVQSSGNADFDDSVVRAIYKSDPLPVDKPGAPKGPVLTLTFGGDFLM